MHTGTGGLLCIITLLHFGILPFLNFVLIEEFEKTCGSCTQPVHFMNAPVKEYLRSATKWIFKE